MKNTAMRLIAAAVISTSFMMPVLASAQTASTTDDQIKTLMEQIRQLQQQLMTIMKARHSDMGSSTPPMMGGDSDGTKRPCPAFARDLRRGAKGDDVRDMQEHLAQAMPDAFSEDNVTGVFGPMTEKALKHFQEMNGVGTSTGVFGPRTRGEMGKHCGEMMGHGRMGGMMGSSTMPWADGRGPGHMMGTSTRPWALGDDHMGGSMGSSTMPHPDGMPGKMGGEMNDGDHHGPKPPLPLIPMPGQQH